ncbi:MAG: oligoendopeptidase F [Eubacteriales bacterium]|nr:oligoendopeptidase F [Eubacteriales bacterium]
MITLPQRSEVEKKYQWNLADIFETTEKFNDEFEYLQKNINTLEKYKGKLGDSKVLLEAFNLESELSERLERVYVYAYLMRDQDTTDSVNNARATKTDILLTKFSTITSYILPELTSESDEYLEGLTSDENFAKYKVTLKEILRTKKHILSEKEERILSKAGAFTGDFEETFIMFDNADIKFKSYLDQDKNRVKLSHGLYSLALQSSSQNDRKKAFNSMFNAYKDMINTIATNYAGNVKKDWFYADVRGFKSSMEKATFYENVSPKVYKALVKNVSDNFDVMHDYVAYRKKALGLDVLNMYDMYVPIVEGADIKLTYEESVSLVKEALKPLGKEYADILNTAFSSGWIDVVENKGKKSGAYSWGAYGVHPYVLLNYQQTTHDVFTIAHELGHAIHSYYSSSNQPYEDAGYVIFVAEIASTVNEVLLIKHLLNTTTDKKIRKYLLSYYMDMFRTTVFRQTMFAEFELKAHEMVEKDIPLNAENLSKEYYKLNKRYYGKAVKHNSLIKYEWARIPHFYTAFYVYKYATGLISAVNIASRILEDEKNVEGYKNFLKAGCSMPPLDILKLAGVDLETSEPYEVAFKEFRDTLKELKEID